jgi:hypothetical protein
VSQYGNRLFSIQGCMTGAEDNWTQVLRQIGTGVNLALASSGRHGMSPLSSPLLDTGTQALIVVGLAWLTR